jgi:hypothetical protein
MLGTKTSDARSSKPTSLRSRADVNQQTQRTALVGADDERLYFLPLSVMYHGSRSQTKVNARTSTGESKSEPVTSGTLVT